MQIIALAQVEVDGILAEKVDPSAFTAVQRSEYTTSIASKINVLVWKIMLI